MRARWMRVALVALAGVASGCSLFVVKGGRLHAAPSSAADLPFRSDGVYVSTGATLPCGRGAEGLLDLPADSVRAESAAFTTTGEFLLVTGSDLGASWARRGNYLVSGDRVDARTYTDGGDSSYKGYVTRYAITATGPESFVMDQTVDRPPQWVRYNTYTPAARFCVRTAYTFLAPAQVTTAHRPPGASG